MSYRETSAWITVIALGFASWSYFSFVVNQSAGLDALVAPSLPALINYTITLISVLVLLHITSAIIYRKTVDRALDEREKLIEIKASHYAGILLGVLVVAALVHTLLNPLIDSHFLFYAVLASVIVSQLCESVLKIYYHRRGI